jgi:CBS domain-containing protein
MVHATALRETIRRRLLAERGNAAILEIAMSQQRPPETRAGAAGSGRGASQFIEKGWMVYDAVEHPIGNVTDIDTTRDVLLVDGRSQGFGTYEIPLSFVESAGSNEVHLSKVVDTSVRPSGGTPRFVDPPATATTSGTTRSRSRSRTEPAATVAGSSTRSRAGSSSTTPVGTGTMSQFSPPYAAPEPRDPGPAWTDADESGWSATKVAMAGLALGGLAVTTYFMRRRMRRKTPFERFVDTASDYFDVASDFTRNRHPAWWASLAAAALPLAYYAWPSPKPTPTAQARGHVDELTSQLESYLNALSGWLPWTPDIRPSMADRMRSRLPRHLPSMSDFEMPSSWQMPTPAMWRSSDRRSTWDWSPRPDVAGTAGALAAGALAIYLIRRATSKPSASIRIGDVMTRRPRVIQPDATVADAAAMMRRMDVGALPVCDGTRLIGMLTDRDITTRSTADGRDPHLTPVRDVMSPGLAWASEDDLVEEAARIMREHRIRRLPIVDGRHTLVGVVSLGDLAVDVADDDLSGETLERISEQTRPARDW